MPRAELRARISANSAQFRREMTSVKGISRSTSAAIKGIFFVAFGQIGAAFSQMTAKMLLKPAMDVQVWRKQFAVLLGDASKAKNRIDELMQFSLKTPFTLPQITRASRILEVLTNGALSTGKALKMVGDAAASAGTQGAAVGENFANIAV